MLHTDCYVFCERLIQNIPLAASNLKVLIEFPLKVGHSSNFLYQGFAEKYFLGIYLHGKA